MRATALRTQRRFTPVVSGKLRRSLRFRWMSDGFELLYQVKYANRVNRTSKRNRNYARRGGRAVTRAIGSILRRYGQRLRLERIERTGGGRLRLRFAFQFV